MIYTLNLNTECGVKAPGISVQTNFLNVTWEVNWDELFKGKNKDFKRCRLYASGMNMANIPAPPEILNGMVFCNLVSDTQKTSSVTSGVFLGFIRAQMVKYSTNNWWQMFLDNTTNTDGISIITPEGQSKLNIRVTYNNNAIAKDFTVIYNSGQNYTMCLTFEFEDE